MKLLQNSALTNRRAMVALSLACILLVGAGLRLWGLAHVDLQGDPAYSAFMARGWLDFVGTNNQTSPIVWFGSIPWWGYLSFSGKPLLTFLIQFLFMSAFGDTTFVTLVPYAIASLACIFVLYLVGTKFHSRTVGLLAAGFFSLSSYAVWLSRSGYIEPIETIAILILFWSVLMLIKTNNYLYAIAWGIFTGMALLSKYTALAVLPAGIITLLLYQRDAKTKRFLLYFFASLLITLLPIIIYNYMMFLTRGHPDADLSAMLGLTVPDFGISGSRRPTIDMIGNGLSVARNFMVNSSLPFMVLLLGGFGYSLLAVLQKKRDILTVANFIFAAVIILMFLFTGTAARHTAILLPFLCIATALWIDVIVKKFKSVSSYYFIVIGIITLIAVTETLYTVNTNIIRNPRGKAGATYGLDRFYALGFDELEQYLLSKNLIFRTQPRRITKLADLDFDISTITSAPILVDNRMVWFSMMWYVERYRIYYGIPIFPLFDLTHSMKRNGFTLNDMTAATKEHDFWFIYTTQREQSDGEAYEKIINDMRSLLANSGVKPEKIIKDYRGQTAFEIYHVTD